MLQKNKFYTTQERRSSVGSVPRYSWKRQFSITKMKSTAIDVDSQVLLVGQQQGTKLRKHFYSPKIRALDRQ